ncbi:MAG: Hsp20/alpha crystallin family protein [Gammaproteobacteria bacterium]|nr:Hsp20/alpha crystallin family protein [Gammaproteobacteria bacterium]
MAIMRWEPFRDFDDAFRRAERLFRRWPAVARGESASEAIEWAPAADISETDKEYVIKAELPDVKKEEITVSVADGAITISGERKREKESKDEKVHRIERFHGTFTRSFGLPEDADTANVRAECKDGVLTVRLPKIEARKASPVQVKVQ